MHPRWSGCGGRQTDMDPVMQVDAGSVMCGLISRSKHFITTGVKAVCGLTEGDVKNVC